MVCPDRLSPRSLSDGRLPREPTSGRGKCPQTAAKERAHAQAYTRSWKRTARLPVWTYRRDPVRPHAALGVPQLRAWTEGGRCADVLRLAPADLAGPETGGACLLRGGKDDGTVAAGVLAARTVVIDAAFGVAVQFARGHDGAGHAQHQQQARGQEETTFFHPGFSWALTSNARQSKTAARGRIPFPSSCTPCGGKDKRRRRAKSRQCAGSGDAGPLFL